MLSGPARVTHSHKAAHRVELQLSINLHCRRGASQNEELPSPQRLRVETCDAVNSELGVQQPPHESCDEAACELHKLHKGRELRVQRAALPATCSQASRGEPRCEHLEAELHVPQAAVGKSLPRGKPTGRQGCQPTCCTTHLMLDVLLMRQ